VRRNLPKIDLSGKKGTGKTSTR